MKKYLMTLAAVLCCAMVSIVFTSCSKDDDNSDSELYSYVAVGGATVKNNLLVVPLTDYTDAIKSAVGSGLVKQNDQKVIQACDAVYAKHKSDYGSSISGTIQITRSKLGDSNSEQVIKEYTY